MVLLGQQRWNFMGAFSGNFLLPEKELGWFMGSFNASGSSWQKVEEWGRGLSGWSCRLERRVSIFKDLSF